MFNYAIKTLLLPFLLCISASSFSAVVGELFHSSVEVLSQQSSDRGEAFNQALLKTLLKVSGHRDLVLDPAVQSIFYPAERYVQSYSYKENPRFIAYLEYKKSLSNQESPSFQTPSLVINDNLSSSIGAAEPIHNNEILDPNFFNPEPLPYLLEVDFASKALETKMKQAKLPIWGNVRPEIMFWIVIESEGVRELISSSTTASFNDELFKLSSDYALPISLPVGDKVDTNALSMSGLWGLFPDAIDQAKLRYASNGNLMVRIYQSMTNAWSANWHFSINGVFYTGFLHDSSLTKINNEIFNFLSTTLSERYSTTTSEMTTNQLINIEVSNISSFKDYVDVQVFLENLSPIKSVTLNWVEGSVMSFSLELNNTPEQLQEYLSLSGRLQFISSTSNKTLASPIYFDNTQATMQVVDQDLPSSFILTEKYKWLKSTPQTIKK